MAVLRPPMEKGSWKRMGFCRRGVPARLSTTSPIPSSMLRLRRRCSRRRRRTLIVNTIPPTTRAAAPAMDATTAIMHVPEQLPDPLVSSVTDGSRTDTLLTEILSSVMNVVFLYSCTVFEKEDACTRLLITLSSMKNVPLRRTVYCTIRDPMRTLSIVIHSGGTEMTAARSLRRSCVRLAA